MTVRMSRFAALAGLAGLVLCGTLFAADEEISFKRRGDEEKRFVRAVGTTIVQAAHKSAKKIELLDHKYTQPKAGRTELSIKMEYHGAVSGKRYVAEVVVKIDSSNKDAWEVLNIDYSDNNNVPYNERKIQELIKRMNR